MFHTYTISLYHVNCCILLLLAALSASANGKELNESNDTVVYYDRYFHQQQLKDRKTANNRFNYVSPSEPEVRKTPHSSSLNTNDLLLEPSLYPRPSGTRNVLSLNGVYEFCLDGQQMGMQNNWQLRHLGESCSKQDLFRMPVPAAYNDITPLKRVRDHVGWVWYETEIVCPSATTNNDHDENLLYLLRFDSVNYEALVWLNGKKLGTHIGGHLPFSFSLMRSDLCNLEERNRLSIAVNNNLTINTIPSGKTRQIKLSNGKVVNRFRPDFDFFNYAGILRDVRLYTVPDMYFTDITTYVKNVIFDESDSLSESKNGQNSSLFSNGTNSKPESMKTINFNPLKATVGYKVRIYVPDRIFSWTKSMLSTGGALTRATNDFDKTTSLTLSVSVKDDQDSLVTKSWIYFNISRELIKSSRNELLRYNRRYLELEGDVKIDKPKLWHPYQARSSVIKPTMSDTCNRINDLIDQEQSMNDRLSYRASLYDLEFKLLLGDSSGQEASKQTPRAKDIYNLKIGIKTVELSTEQGPFVINGRPVYLKGFGKHEEQLFRGRSMDLASLMKDVYLIKWTGANVIRTSHYPYSEEFLDEMDAHGIMVIDECPAVGLGYFDDKKLSLHQNIMMELIQRDKNRASVIMWSLANEPRSDLKESNKYFKSLVDFVNRVQLPIKLPLTGAIAQEYNTDHLGQYLDVLMINRYFGWYEDVGFTDQIYEKLTVDLHNWIKKFQRPVMISEYGADSVAGLHKLPDALFSEEFQIDLLKENFRAFDFFMNKNDTRLGNYFMGEMVWNFADFHTHQSLTRVTGNRKGMFTQDRQPKMAAHLIRARYLSLDS